MNTLIIGANSDIARALAETFAREKSSDLVLASRDLDNLKRLATDLQVRFKVNVVTAYLDVTDFASHHSFVDNLASVPDCLIYAAGYLGDQGEQQADFLEAMKSINTNYTGAISLIELIAKKMEQKPMGTIVGISSVAGERGRASNYIYGSAKSGFTSYLSGLRSRLYKKNIHVLTVLPGFVATKMTENLKLPPALTTSAEKVAKEIVYSMAKRKNKIFIKPVWRLIMFIICLIPEPIFKRLNL